MKKHQDSFWGGDSQGTGARLRRYRHKPDIYSHRHLYLTRPTPENVFGILSLVFWTMPSSLPASTLAGNEPRRKGQGGRSSSREILIKLLKKGRLLAFAGLLSFLGVSLFWGTASSLRRSVTCPL